ncbi:MAG TPA: general stress protein [Sporichthyaceae bacterium]|jgi:uncharacterized protein YqgC (DUF456 family)|nr:general stress protein [Sporichthyaceae bacterium]
MRAAQVLPSTGLELEHPMSLAVYENYADAQRAVDYLSDKDFGVAGPVIVGIDLKSVERVTGRLTRGKVAAAGALSGLWIGLFVAFLFTLVDRRGDTGALLTTPLVGAVFGLIWSRLGFVATTRGGTRDFSSISQVVATKYEVMVEHRLAEQARALLAAMPPV